MQVILDPEFAGQSISGLKIDRRIINKGINYMIRSRSISVFFFKYYSRVRGCARVRMCARARVRVCVRACPRARAMRVGGQVGVCACARTLSRESHVR